jgi:hypothetical protein
MRNYLCRYKATISCLWVWSHDRIDEYADNFWVLLQGNFDQSFKCYLPDLNHATVNDVFDPTNCNWSLSDVCTKNNLPHSWRSRPEHIQLLMRWQRGIQRVYLQTGVFSLQILQTKIYSHINTRQNIQLTLESFINLFKNKAWRKCFNETVINLLLQ